MEQKTAGRGSAFWHRPSLRQSGFPQRDNGPRKKFMHWTVTFDEEDAAVYDNGKRGEVEDLDYNELMDAFELHVKS